MQSKHDTAVTELLIKVLKDSTKYAKLGTSPLILKKVKELNKSRGFEVHWVGWG